MTNSSMLSLSAWLGSLVATSRPSSPWPWRWAWGWLLVQVSISLAAGFLWLLGAPLRWALAAPLLLLIAALLGRLTAPHREPATVSSSPATGDPWLRAGVLLVGLWAVLSAWSSLDLGWDGMAIWGLKGRTLAATDGYPLLHPLARSSHPEYPLHLPLLAAVIAQWAGGWQDRLLPLLTAFDVTALGLLLCHALEQRRAGRWARRCLVIALLVSPILWRELTLGKADLNVALCVAAALVGLEAWLRGSRVADLRLAAVAVGLGAWSKQEGMAYGVLFCLLACLLTPRHRYRRLPSALALALAIPLPWHICRWLLGIATEPFAVGETMHQRAPIILRTMLATLARPDLWGLLWWLALPAALWLTAVWGWQRWRGEEAGPGVERHLVLSALFLLGGLGFIVTAYLTSPYNVAWHLHTSLDRLLLQLLPTTVLVAHGALQRLDLTEG